MLALAHLLAARPHGAVNNVAKKSFDSACVVLDLWTTIEHTFASP
jgi:hypothetical protein